MDYNELFPYTFIDDLKCSLCSNYLSYFPIHITTEDQNICGRCKIPEDSTCVQNKVYEVIAKEILFPCRYINEGCVEKLFPRNIVRHEQQCSLRLVKCPTSEFSQCDEVLCSSDITQHCENKHSELILKNGEFSVDLSESEENSNIFLQDNDCFIFKRIFDSTSNKLNCKVYCYESGRRPTADFFELCLKNGLRSLTITGLIELASCTVDNEQISLDVFKSWEHAFEAVEGQLSIGQQKKNSDCKLDQQLLDIFKCSVCSKYILPPFHMYICYEKNMCLSCSKSKYGIVQVKIDCFDKLAAELIFPCENQKNGCDYTSQPSLLKEHQLHCPYETNSCPVSKSENCSWTGPCKDAISHINKEHHKLIAGSSEFSVQLACWKGYNPLIKRNYIIKFSKHFFRFSFSAGNNSFRWTLQMIGEFQTRFNYELQIINFNRNEKLLAVQACVPLIAEDQLFQKDNEYRYFKLDQFNHMLSGNGTLHFKVRVIK